MKRSISKIPCVVTMMLCLCCTTLPGFGNDIIKIAGKEFSKSVIKEFDIARDGTVGVTNKYGNIDVRTWDQARVKIEVTITTEARNEDAANDVFNRITIAFDNSPSVVRATTNIETQTSWKSWFNWGSNGNQFEINYVVYLPATVVVELDNRYGDIYLADMQNRASISLRYGDMKLGSIAGNTTVSMGYADGSITSTRDLTLDLSYSELFIGKAANMTFDGRYSDLEIESAGDIHATTGFVDVKVQKMGRLTNDGKYDDFVIDDAVSLDVDSKYSGFVVNHLHTYADFAMSYGSVDIQYVYPGFQSISINSSYTDVSVDVDENAAFNFEASTRYCGIDHYGLEIYHEIEKSTESTVKGYRGSRDATAKITATMNYGGLTIR